MGFSKNEPDRLTWTLVLIFLNWIGAILYWTVRERQPGEPTMPAVAVPRPVVADPRPAAAVPQSLAPALSIEEHMNSLDPDWRYKPADYQAALRSRAVARGSAARA